MKFNKNYLIVNGHLTHTVAFRKKDCAKYLSLEEILGILDIMGMRRDGTIVTEKALAKNVLYFMQKADAKAA